MALLLALGQAGVATAAPAPATCGRFTATIVGTNNAETLFGTTGRDIIQARRGNDTIYGLDGNDQICSGPGDDTVYGGYGDLANPAPPSGNDRLLGGDNMDTLAGEDGNDFLDGSCPCPARDFPTIKDRCDGGTGTDVAQNCEIKTNFP